MFFDNPALLTGPSPLGAGSLALSYDTDSRLVSVKGLSPQGTVPITYTYDWSNCLIKKGGMV